MGLYVLMPTPQAEGVLDLDCSPDPAAGEPARGRSSDPPPGLVTVAAGEPGEDCAAACGRRQRVCREWGAIYAHAAAAVALGDAAVLRPTARDQAPVVISATYGACLSEPRWDLPVLPADVGGGGGGGLAMRVGTPRLFRCEARTDRGSRRVCPCFNGTAVEALVRRSLFS